MLIVVAVWLLIGGAAWLLIGEAVWLLMNRAHLITLTLVLVCNTITCNNFVDASFDSQQGLVNSFSMEQD